MKSPITLNVKPLSVNQAWKGKRFKTNKYKAYEREVIMLLAQVEIPEGELQIHLTFGFSSKLSDFDNPVKPFIDCLQKRYGFNDRMIKRAIIDVENVKRGDDFIRFFITRK